MNGSHIALGSIGTSAIASILMWMTHWPIQPLDQNTAMAISGLAVAVLGGGGVAFFTRGNGNGQSEQGAAIAPAKP